MCNILILTMLTVTIITLPVLIIQRRKDSVALLW